MRVLVSLLFLLLPITGVSEPCQSDWKESATRQFIYQPVILAPGDTFKVHNRQFVMVRQPFTDFGTGKRYAITFPVEFFDAGEEYHEDYRFSVTARTGEECSDVWIEGEPLASHPQQVIEQHLQKFLSGNLGWPTSRYWKMEHKIRLSTTLEFQVGYTSGELKYDWQTEAGSVTTFKREAPLNLDFAESFDWNYFEQRRAIGLTQLRSIARRVYITPLD